MADMFECSLIGLHAPKNVEPGDSQIKVGAKCTWRQVHQHSGVCLQARQSDVSSPVRVCGLESALDRGSTLLRIKVNELWPITELHLLAVLERVFGKRWMDRSDLEPNTIFGKVGEVAVEMEPVPRY